MAEPQYHSEWTAGFKPGCNSNLGNHTLLLVIQIYPGLLYLKHISGLHWLAPEALPPVWATLDPFPLIASRRIPDHGILLFGLPQWDIPSVPCHSGHTISSLKDFCLFTCLPHWGGLESPYLALGSHLVHDFLYGAISEHNHQAVKSHNL